MQCGPPVPLYLLFNEGYLSGHSDGIRDDVCFEAMRLSALLLETPSADQPMARALLALMCFHSARLPARRDDHGNLVLLMDQDRSLWDARLVAQGFTLLQASNPTGALTSFHVEAMLSATHVLAQRPEDTDWPGMLQLYHKLLELKPSPVVEVNLAIATARAHNAQAGLELLLAPSAKRSLDSYHYYHASVGQLCAETQQYERARDAWQRAVQLCRNETEARCLRAKLAALTAPA